MVKTKKEDVIVNMVMAITTCSQLSKNVVVKKKEPHKNKNLANQKKEEKLQHLFEVAIKNMQQKKSLIELHGTRFKLLPEPTFLGILAPMPKTLINSAKNKDYQKKFDFGGNRPTIVGK